MVDNPGRFTWYELITTDMAAAKAFYAEVVGWGAQDASTPDLAYTLFAAGSARISGLMDLPEDGRKMGATPRWMGYVGVDDVDAAADRIKRLGGAVYVPPTNSNIGRISVVADPQMATADAEIGPTDTYQLFSAGGQTIGGMLTKRPVEPVPYWLYYFNVGDIDAAAACVKTGGGRIFEGPLALPGGSWVARCTDPQGAFFALQGNRSLDGIGRAPASEVGWSTEWSGISSRGRLVTKPRG